jgi:hypothetical protein
MQLLKFTRRSNRRERNAIYPLITEAVDLARQQL